MAGRAEFAACRSCPSRKNDPIKRLLDGRTTAIPHEIEKQYDNVRVFHSAKKHGEGLRLFARLQHCTGDLVIVQTPTGIRPASIEADSANREGRADVVVVRGSWRKPPRAVLRPLGREQSADDDVELVQELNLTDMENVPTSLPAGK